MVRVLAGTGKTVREIAWANNVLDKDLLNKLFGKETL